MSGDLDWDNSGEDGWEHVKQLESYLKENVTANHSFSPNDGCPGPYEIEVDESLVIITINSQWFMHPNERPELTESSCKVLSESEFWEKLEDLIDDHEDKNVIIAAHHPIYSNGHYSGKVDNWKNYIPFYGGIYESYRQQDGTPRDMQNKKYQDYIQRIKKIADEQHGVIYVAGHEFNTEILSKDENFYINSGASSKGQKLKSGENTLFGSAELSYTVIQYFNDGGVAVKVFAENESVLLERNLLCPNCSGHISPICEAVNHRYMPCQEMKRYSEDKEFVNSLQGKRTTVITGEQYRAEKFKTKMMGQHYRKEWTTPVELPYLDIGSVEGGMIPYAKGGGKQTDALKFVLSDGRHYGFRSVNKNTARDEAFILNNTVVTDFSQDLISNQLLYGDLPFYHMTNLGNSRNLRAYRSNQFIGNSGTYFSSQLRYDLGTMFNNFLPIGIGLTGFYDSGSVFDEEDFSFDDWHQSYEGGFYLSFLNGQYNISYTVGRNEFEDTLKLF